MSRACQICNHPQKLQIDRAIAEGKSKSLISREFGISTDSVGHHSENHLSRQLTQAYEKKGLAESTDLLGRIDKIIDRAEKIFSRNYEKNNMGGDTLALKALGEQRSTLELLCKISAYLHEARLLELQNSQGHIEAEQQARTQAGMERLTDNELDVMLYLQRKMSGGDMDGVEVPAVFKAALPVPSNMITENLDKPNEAGALPVSSKANHRPLPLPKPPFKTICTPDSADDMPDPGITPGPEPEPEQPRGLPPAPTREIPGGGRGLKLRRHLLGRKIYNGLPE